MHALLETKNVGEEKKWSRAWPVWQGRVEVGSEQSSEGLQQTWL